MDSESRTFRDDWERMEYLGSVIAEMAPALHALTAQAVSADTADRGALLRRVVASSNALRTAAYNLTRTAGLQLQREEEGDE